ncbi:MULTISPECIES: hypothetical protein [Methylomonas]|uniref:Cytochrome C n=1 Tax=Methylomonas koyamae TaxID=702114 RepID=A0A177NAQ7_9GAMM|nr:hypothetical protein [Methylomonas koyamae]OAI14694.1 hypothetical protein A1355_12090 [Methylomonas koyamae]
MKTLIFPLSLVAASALLVGCAHRHDEQSSEQIQQNFVPGLGEFMAQTAARHAKLWFAGQARNWPLAAYEVEELHEGLEDAGRYHPSHKQIKEPIPSLIAAHMDQPLAKLEQAIAARDPQAFIENYDKLTEACNSCHRQTEFGFNVVVRSTSNPFTNQAFGTSE